MSENLSVQNLVRLVWKKIPFKAEGENSDQSPIMHEGRQVTRAELTLRNKKIFRYMRECFCILPGKPKLALLVFRAGQMSRCCGPGTVLMRAQA